MESKVQNKPFEASAEEEVGRGWALEELLVRRALLEEHADVPDVEAEFQKVQERRLEIPG